MIRIDPGMVAEHDQLRAGAAAVIETGLEVIADYTDTEAVALLLAIFHADRDRAATVAACALVELRRLKQPR